MLHRELAPVPGKLVNHRREACVVRNGRRCAWLDTAALLYPVVQKNHSLPQLAAPEERAEVAVVGRSVQGNAEPLGALPHAHGPVRLSGSSISLEERAEGHCIHTRALLLHGKPLLQDLLRVPHHRRRVRRQPVQHDVVGDDGWLDAILVLHGFEPANRLFQRVGPATLAQAAQEGIVSHDGGAVVTGRIALSEVVEHAQARLDAAAGKERSHQGCVRVNSHGEPITVHLRHHCCGGLYISRVSSRRYQARVPLRRGPRNAEVPQLREHAKNSLEVRLGRQPCHTAEAPAAVQATDDRVGRDLVGRNSPLLHLPQDAEARDDVICLRVAVEQDIVRSRVGLRDLHTPARVLTKDPLPPHLLNLSNGLRGEVQVAAGNVRLDDRIE
eukprot:scaffold624_cov214-Pinguiococcus_pyrenoidosus.AAC.7